MKKQKKKFEKNLKYIQLKIFFSNFVNKFIKFQRKFNCNSFKFEIFAINLNSTFDFQFQSIKSLIRRNDANTNSISLLKKTFQIYRKHQKNTFFSI